MDGKASKSKGIILPKSFISCDSVCAARKIWVYWCYRQQESRFLHRCSHHMQSDVKTLVIGTYLWNFHTTPSNCQSLNTVYRISYFAQAGFKWLGWEDCNPSIPQTPVLVTILPLKNLTDNFLCLAFPRSSYICFKYSAELIAKHIDWFKSCHTFCSMKSSMV